MRYLNLEQILLIHDDQIEKYGGSHGIRDLPLLESAIFRPQSAFAGKDLYPDLFTKSSVFMQSIILNHPFVDGNKRTATASTLVLLHINQYVLTCSDRELIDLVVNTATRKVNIEQIAEFLHKNSEMIE